jgi:tRNA threonylcarbamoyladenosine biosynthesis protein TsaE
LIRVLLPDSAATEAAGEALAALLPMDSLVAYLQGDLGAGKTTLVRGVLHGLGHRRRVPSPTYTLVEPYTLAGRQLQHLDLYRIADAEELAYIGVRDLGGLMFIEWPERGGKSLPPADLVCHLGVDTPGRVLEVNGRSSAGKKLSRQWLKALQALGLVVEKESEVKL